MDMCLPNQASEWWSPISWHVYIKSTTRVIGLHPHSQRQIVQVPGASTLDKTKVKFFQTHKQTPYMIINPTQMKTVQYK